MLGTPSLLRLCIRDNRDYAMAYAMGTSSGCYPTLAIHRATEALVGNARR